MRRPGRGRDQNAQAREPSGTLKTCIADAYTEAAIGGFHPPVGESGPHQLPRHVRLRSRRGYRSCQRYARRDVQPGKAGLPGDLGPRRVCPLVAAAQV